MQIKEAIPKDAAAVILLRENSTEVFLAQRNPQTKFLGGWHAFPGGKIDREDAEITVKNCSNAELAKFIVCAVRETFEETRVLLVRGGNRITKGQRASLHDDLISQRFSFAEILENWGLWIDADDFRYTGFWTTPKFSPVRFKTRFFIAKCPPKQIPVTEGELVAGEFLAPKDALNLWENGKILISPPVLISLQEMAEANAGMERRGDAEMRRCGDKQKYDGEMRRQENGISSIPLVPASPRPRVSASPFPLQTCAQKLLEKSEKCGGEIEFIEFNPHIVCFPLKTETLPPAAHTNCFIVGGKEFVVIDAASKDESEQSKLHAFVDSFIAKDFTCKEIIVSHLHPDHFGGEISLQKHLLEKFSLEVPVSAHRLTAESLRGKVVFQRFIEDGENLRLKDKNGKTFYLQTLHTPGHARGHLAFYDAEAGFLLSSDNIISTGSVAIAPPEGNMADYLKSLEKMKNLPNLRFLCGSHGAAVYDAKGKIEEYIAHRTEREKMILEAFQNGAKTPREIIGKVYISLPPELLELAEKSVEAHLEKLKDEAKI